MKSIEVLEVRAIPCLGSNIGDCFKEAMLISISEWRDVRLTFNGKDYLIRPDQLLATCKEQ